jgi:integrase
VLGDTGLRINEALALQWRDIDGTRLHVRRALSESSDGRMTLAPPKSRYGKRSVPISHELAAGLWQARKHARWNGDRDPVFATTSRDGDATPHHARNLFGRVLKPAARKAGVPWCGFHTLRHTCATRLFHAGLNPKAVQVWLGHHSPAFTMAT